MLIALPILISVAHAQSVKVTYKTLSTKKKGDYTATVKYPVFGGGAVATFASTQWKNNATRGFNGFLKMAKEARAEERKGKFHTGEYYYDGQAKVTLSKPNLISGYMAMSNYVGGAHGMNWPEPINVALINGKPGMLKLAHLLKKGVDPMQTISPFVIEKLRAQGAAWVESGEVKALDKKQLESFVITPKGLHYMFEPYAMGSYAEGQYHVELSWKEVDEFIDWTGPAKYAK